MVSTFQGLAVALIALLPGATYTFAYERQAGSFAITTSDRVVRFLAASAVFQALLAGPTYIAYKHWIATGHLSSGQVSAWWIELVAVGYIIVPAAAGTLIGMGQTRTGWQWAWTRWFATDAPEPTAWDHVWRHMKNRVVRIRLKSGVWTAGAWGTVGGRRPYAAGYPEPGDLYLSVVFVVDRMTGEFDRGPGGALVEASRSHGILLRRDEIEFLEIMGA
jgi:hypothetical protein